MTNLPSDLTFNLTPANSPVYEVECGECGGRKQLPRAIKVPPGFPYPEEIINGIQRPACKYVNCPKCHGTGKVRKCVVGWVRVEAVPHYGDCEAWIVWAIPELKIAGPTTKGLIKQIVTMFRAGTLPDEVAENLKEIEVTHD